MMDNDAKREIPDIPVPSRHPLLGGEYVGSTNMSGRWPFGAMCQLIVHSSSEP